METRHFKMITFGFFFPIVEVILMIGFCTFTSSSSPYDPADGWTEKALIKHILEDYDMRSRPVVDDVTPIKQINPNQSVQQITVEFGLDLIQILDLNEMDQVLTTSVRSLYRWKDYHLTWDPVEFENISFVNIPTNRIWLPDISLYNYADERLEERRECEARVYYDGTVIWHPMAIYKSTCSVRIKYFPFDKQGCRLKFGPWTYDGFRVNITFYNNVSDMNRKGYVESPEWTILVSSAIFTEVTYPCCPEPYPDISFYVWIKRQPAFYNYILILPCFLLSSLTLVLFWLPPETPAKMVLGMNIFVAFFLLLLLLEDTTPSASNSFPLLGTYYCLNMGIITLSTFLSCIIVNFHFRGDNRKEVPFWLKKLVIYHGSRILFVNLGSKYNQDSFQFGHPSKSSAAGGNVESAASRRSSLVMSCSGRGLSGDLLPDHSTTRHILLHDEMGLQNAQHQKTSKKKRKRAEATTYHQQVSINSTTSHQSHHHTSIVVADHLSPSTPFSLTSASFTPPPPPAANHNHNQQQSAVYSATPVPYFHPLSSIDSSAMIRGDDDIVLPDRVFSNLASFPESVLCDMPSSASPPPHLALSMPSSRGNGRFLSGHNVPAPLAQKRPKSSQLVRDVRDIVKALRYVQRMHDSKERINKIFSEWRAVGMVLDRFFFVCYVFTIVLSIILFFPKSGGDEDIGDHTKVK